MSFMSWGMYPVVKNTVFGFEREERLCQVIDEHDKLIPYGNGRSYGDSALSVNIINVRPHDYFIDFTDQQWGNKLLKKTEKDGILHRPVGID